MGRIGSRGEPAATETLGTAIAEETPAGQGSGEPGSVVVVVGSVVVVATVVVVPVVVVALACYPTGWLPQPELGSGTWWLWRLGWIVVLTLVTAGELTLLWFGRSFFARPTPAVAIRLPARWSEPMLVAGTVLAAGALWRFSSTGFAPGGHLPLPGMLSYAAGIILVSLYPIGIRRELGSAGKEPRTDDRTRP